MACDQRATIITIAVWHLLAFGWFCCRGARRARIASLCFRRLCSAIGLRSRFRCTLPRIRCALTLRLPLLGAVSALWIIVDVPSRTLEIERRRGDQFFNLPATL